MASNLSNTQSAVIPHNHPISDITNLSTQLGNKQDKLEAGSNISIGPDGKTISAIDTKYSAGANININANNEISAVDTKYDNATQTEAGLMSADDKKKLDGIEEGAGAVKVTGVKGDAETNYREGNVNITKANIGLGNVDNTSDANKPISTVTQAALNLKQNIADMPTKLTDFTNDGDGTDPFITKAVNDLTNYYTKTQTYTKSEVNTLISNFGGFEVVATLPTSDIKPNVIYLLGPIGTGADKYQEYIYYNSTWTLIGETTVDLTNYATKTEVEQGLASKITNPSGGTEGQVLVKTQNGEAWQNAPATGVISSNNTYENMVHLSQAEYEALETKDPNTFYSTPDDESGAFDPENTGNIGDKLEKTATGYQWVDGELVEIIPDDYSAMRGPCAEGFHVPMKSELEGLASIMSGFGFNDGTEYKSKLHMPYAGYRLYQAGYTDIREDGVNGYYWSSSPYSGSAGNFSPYLTIRDTYQTLVPVGGFECNGYSIRPFKNGYVEPDSSWTVSYGTLGSAGIFYNSILGLISITDGTNRYTIADKNLGATVVYNSGDTLSESNCGKIYQRGNNYAFPYTGSITESGTQVDASSYGPGNYYSSSTFITQTSSPYAWDSSSNPNLRGGVTGVIPGGKYVGNDRINEVPTEGTTGQVLVKTDSGYARDAVPEASKTVNLKRTQVLSVTTQDQKSYTATGDGFIEYHCSASGGYYARNRFYYGNQMIVEVGESGDARGYIPIVKGVTVSCQRGSQSGTSEAWLWTFY